MKRSMIPGAGLLGALALTACGGSDQPVQLPVPAVGENPIEYPVSMWDQRVEGKTVLMVRVNEFGNVDSVYVDTTSTHPALDSAALSGVRKLQFTPARRGEHAITMWIRFPVRFTRDSVASMGTPTAPGQSPQP